MSLYKVWASYKPTAVAANFVGDKGDIFYDEDGFIKNIYPCEDYDESAQ